MVGTEWQILVILCFLIIVMEVEGVWKVKEGVCVGKGVHVWGV